MFTQRKYFTFLILAVTFEIGGSGSDRGDPKTPNNEEEPEWECVWKCHTATPVHHMSFSPDGTLFATSGKSDRLVKIWYENKNGTYYIPNNLYSGLNLISKTNELPHFHCSAFSE